VIHLNTIVYWLISQKTSKLCIYFKIKVAKKILMDVKLSCFDTVHLK